MAAELVKGPLTARHRTTGCLCAAVAAAAYSSHSSFVMSGRLSLVETFPCTTSCVLSTPLEKLHSYFPSLSHPTAFHIDSTHTHQYIQPPFHNIRRPSFTPNYLPNTFLDFHLSSPRTRLICSQNCFSTLSTFPPPASLVDQPKVQTWTGHRSQYRRWVTQCQIYHTLKYANTQALGCERSWCRLPLSARSCVC